MNYYLSRALSRQKGCFRIGIMEFGSNIIYSHINSREKQKLLKKYHNSKPIPLDQEDCLKFKVLYPAYKLRKCFKS